MPYQPLISMAIEAACLQALTATRTLPRMRGWYGDELEFDPTYDQARALLRAWCMASIRSMTEVAGIPAPPTNGAAPALAHHR